MVYQFIIAQNINSHFPGCTYSENRNDEESLATHLKSVSVLSVLKTELHSILS